MVPGNTDPGGTLRGALEAGRPPCRAMHTRGIPSEPLLLGSYKFRAGGSVSSGSKLIHELSINDGVRVVFNTDDSFT